MPQHTTCLFVGTAIVAGGAFQHRQESDYQTGIAEDELSYTRMVRKLCALKWYEQKKDVNITQHMQEGRWAMKAQNIDPRIASVAYQNEVDGRCALVFSGYNGALTGYIEAGVDLTTPMTTWSMCRNDLFAPYVKILRVHTALKNWTHIANFVGSNDTTCKGELVVVTESAGGGLAEILAACANTGSIGEVQSEELPAFQVDALYTFGAPVSAMKPVRNPLHPSGCFRGKRIFNTRDTIPFYAGINGLKHSMVDSLEIFMRKDGPTFKVTPCLSDVSNPALTGHSKPGPRPDPELVHSLKWKMPDGDPVEHEPITYQTSLSFFERAGFGNLTALDLVEPAANEFVNAQGERNQNEEPGDATAQADQGSPDPQ